MLQPAACRAGVPTRSEVWLRLLERLEEERATAKILASRRSHDENAQLMPRRFAIVAARELVIDVTAAPSLGRSTISWTPTAR
jgi:hypothetical protein